jgi:predicted DCC family thiol-disulfide oxidoreductase YuxK
MVDTTLAKELSTEGPVVFYDGDCGLCDRSVKGLIKLDKARRLRYATLQGETATRLMGEPQGPAEGWAIKLLDDQGLHDGSTAALRAASHAGGVGVIAKVLLFVPRFIRDGVYRWIARNRYRWFGKVDACLLPSPALRQQFLP